jgi:DNA-binding transcriptional regulator GbsR (MarR family)
MNLEEAKAAFIDQWGAMAGAWGVPRSMAQIYAQLLVHPKALNTDELMDMLSISRGNISMSMKSLLEWGLVNKVFIPGDRKDYYEAEKDMWTAMSRMMAERKRIELDPVLRQLEKLKKIKDNNADPNELLAFNQAIGNIFEMAQTVNHFLSSIEQTRRVKLIKWINKLK